jgi:hypothetical protein
MQERTCLIRQCIIYTVPTAITGQRDSGRNGSHAARPVYAPAVNRVPGLEAYAS